MTCMPKPSACGFPDATNTGVTPGTALTPASGVVTLNQAGQVYENRQVNGSIIVTAPNVTIRNVRLVVTDPYYGISVKNGNDWDNSGANLTLDHVEIDMNGKLNVKGIAFDSYTAKSVFFHNGADCAHFGQERHDPGLVLRPGRTPTRSPTAGASAAAPTTRRLPVRRRRELSRSATTRSATRTSRPRRS